MQLTEFIACLGLCPTDQLFPAFKLIGKYFSFNFVVFFKPCTIQLGFAYIDTNNIHLSFTPLVHTASFPIGKHLDTIQS